MIGEGCAHASLRDFHEALPHEFRRPCHCVGVDLDAGKQVRISPVVNLCGRAADFDLHAMLPKIGDEIFIGLPVAKLRSVL